MNEYSEYRPTLGLAVSLGYLYDVRSEKVLGQSLLKPGTLPKGLVVEQDLPSQMYRHIATNSLEEKFQNLEISSELGISILCGLLTPSWGAKYLSMRTSSDLLQEASAVCRLRTRCERLHLGEELLPHVNIGAFDSTEATHVVWQIEWGAQVVVTARQEVRNGSEDSDLFGRLNTNRQGAKGSSDTSDRNGIASQIVRNIGRSGFSIDGTSQSDLKSISTSFKFEVIAQGVGNESIPHDFEGVSEFVRAIPSHISTVNDGKGVPIAIHLLPLSEVAKSFNLELANTRILQSLDKIAVDRALERLIDWAKVIGNLSSYLDLLHEHAFCIPGHQIRKAKRKKGHAEKDEESFKDDLRATIIDIRNGSKGTETLQTLLKDTDEIEEFETYNSITKEYVGKIAFANEVKAKGATYSKTTIDSLDEIIIRHGTDDLYILYFSEGGRKLPSWGPNRQVLLDLLNEPPPSSHVLVVDLDSDSSGGAETNPEEPRIEHRRSGKVIVNDVIKDLEELRGKDLIKCAESQLRKPLAAHPPPGRRILRVLCPGEHCFGRLKSTWTCPQCRELVSYEHKDEYLYCSCSWYPAALATFKCAYEGHGAKFVRYGDDARLKHQLQNLDPDEEYNILLLGRSGVGKSMFINSFSMYNQFATLDEAIADPDPIKYPIPFSFRFQNDNLEDELLTYGEETSTEKFSLEGQSSTRKTKFFNFDIKGKRFRFIDTPGILDTSGIDQDRLNLKDVFEALKEIQKLNAVILLLQPNETRLDVSFKFCITELLRSLHTDVANNILFGFTNASSTNFSLGSTSAPLDHMLKELGNPISRRPDNQFFFDAGGYMFLAHLKKNFKMWPRKEQFDSMWEESVKQSDKLILAVMRLQPHDLEKTLRLNQARSFFDGMAKPLTQFLAAMEKSKADLDKAKRDLDDLDTEGQNLRNELAKLKVKITVPVRQNLQQKRTVCSNKACSSQVRDADGKMCTKYNLPCHNNCDIDAPDEIIGHHSLKSCNPFWSWTFNQGNDCSKCGHKWEEHMRVSYVLRDEEREINDPKTIRKIKSNEKAKQAIATKSQECTNTKMDIEREQRQIYETRAQIGVYLEKNSIGGVYIDNSLGHYELRIEMMKREGQHAEAGRLVDQRNVYEDMLRSLREAVEKRTIECPSEESVGMAIKQLEEMPIFGRDLKKCLEEDRVVWDGERHVYVSTPQSKTRERPFLSAFNLNSLRMALI
ncbi:Stonustoxin subunit alpha [Fusarium oxysporum f. sp. raphani]|uniref:Stonustoxin subunit alpha n=1 Tax=Fusarium oxysporum f. sp. raphani TaxID=96318 RepID=A0A8J5P4C5_FUSOX|nr:Stonustoxin subunit alpha [Fusarium oxysporum f. sp. raphani]